MVLAKVAEGWLDRRAEGWEEEGEGWLVNVSAFDSSAAELWRGRGPRLMA